MQYQGCELGWSPLAETQYDAIVADGSFQGVASPMLTAADYQSLVAVMQPANINPRWGLAITWAEGHDGTDPGLAAASVNNLGGIKWVGQAGATDSGIPADTGGTYAAFPDLTAYWSDVVRILGNEIIGPSWAAGDLIAVAEHWTNGPGTGHDKVDQFVRYCQVWPADGGPPVPVVTGQMIVDAAMKHLGDTHEVDGWNGDHLVSGYCQEDVEDWYTEAGLLVPHYPTAVAAHDAAPVNLGEPALGAQIWMIGPGWLAAGHTGIYIGGGRVLSGLASVMISTGWLDLPTYAGWRMPAGISDAPPVRVVEGNPYGPVPLVHPFSSRWYALEDGMGLALPMMGYPRAVEMMTAGGRRIQQFERGWYGTQEAPAPWDVVQLLETEVPK